MRKYSNHTKVVFVMVTPEEKDLIKRYANLRMISQNELMRRGAKLYFEDIRKWQEKHKL